MYILIWNQAAMTNRARYIYRSLAYYIIFAMAWIFLSDDLLRTVVSHEALISLSTTKGIFFVFVSAVGFLLTLRAVPELDSSSNKFNEDSIFTTKKTKRILAYLFSILITLIAIYLYSEISSAFNNKSLFILLMLPITLSALIGGVGPGLLSTLCAAVGSYFLIKSSQGGSYPDAFEQLKWLLLIINGVVVSLISEALQRTSENLTKNKSLLKSIADSTSDAIFVKDIKGRYIFANEASADILNTPINKLIGLTDADLFDLQTAQLLSEIDSVVATKASVQTHEEHITTKRGSEMIFGVTKGPIFDDSGNVCGIFGIARDISEQKRSEQELINRTAALNQAQQLAHIGSWEWNLTTGHHYWSDEIYRIYGRDLSLPPAIYPEVSQYFTHDSWIKLSATIEHALATVESYECEAQLSRASGELRWISARGEPVIASNGEIIAFHGTVQDITEQKQAQLLLEQREQQLERVITGSDQGYWDWNLLTNEFNVSSRFETMLGFMPGELDVRIERWSEIVHPDDLVVAQESINRHLSGQQSNHVAEIRCKTKQGNWLWVLTAGRVVSWHNDGTPWMMSGTHTDISTRKHHELALLESNVVFENSYEGIMVLGPNRLIIKVNPAFSRITGYSSAEAIGQSPRLLSSGLHDALFYQEMWNSLNKQDFWRGEICNRHKNGEIYIESISISVVRDSRAEIQYYIGIFTDITQLKAHQAELDRVAHYDVLTGLPNRRLLSDRLKRSVNRTERSGKSCAICFLDLDGFKEINDRYGHAIGDQLLVGIANNLQAILRIDDTLARMGGDEFVLILSEIASATECSLILDRVLVAVNTIIQIAEIEVGATASIGVCMYPEDHADPDTLLRHADQAMYLAKDAGGNRYQMFDPETERQSQIHRRALELIGLALARDEFVLHYQPKVDLLSGEVVGAEALIRWQHPELGLLFPGDFLSHVYGSKLEQALGEWVIHAALKQATQWAQCGLNVKLSINVSANHLLRSDFAANLLTALSSYPEVPRSSFELEVLETMAIGDMQQAIQTLQQCKEMGVRFSLDDFGTGYSSLTYLRKLPIDTLKIDQSFVRDMLTDPDDFGIVQGVIQLAKVFKLQVIAEGAETVEHIALLRQLGCHLVQGYGIAKPMPANMFPIWCNEWEKQRA